MACLPWILILMFGFLAFIYLITIICIVKYGSYPLMSNSASEHGKEVDNLMWISMILIFFVQTVTQALLHYYAYKYSGKKGQVAAYISDNNKLEFIWSAIRSTQCLNTPFSKFSVPAWLAHFRNNIVDFLFQLDVKCSLDDAKTARDCLKVTCITIKCG